VPLSWEQPSRSVLWLHLLFVRGFWLGFRREIASGSRLDAAPGRAAAWRRGAARGCALNFSSLNISDPGLTRAPPDTPPADTDRHAEVVKVGRTTPNPAI
jgi:hypothetical protein